MLWRNRAGLEVMVGCAYFKLVERNDATALVSGARGQAIDQKVLKYDHVPMKDGDVLKSGELVEVELTLESKNDYEYLLFEDMKPAGFAPSQRPRSDRVAVSPPSMEPPSAARTTRPTLPNIVLKASLNCA